jgi:ferrous-iron efflux pump FieF
MCLLHEIDSMLLNRTMTSPASDAHQITRRITTLSVGVAIVLIVLKSFALGASGSVSIMASLTDSALDLIASLATFFAVRWAAADPDAEHPYGHGKAEGLASLVQSGIVLASAFFIGFEAIKRMIRPEQVTDGMWAIGVIAVSMALTGWLIWQQGRAIRKTGSLAVEGDRAHYAADLAANFVVLVGVGSGALLNAPGLDALAGLVVAIWLAWGAVGLLRKSSDHLLDGVAPAEDRNAVVALVLEDDRISNVHQLRTRQAGQVLMVQMHVDLDGRLSLKEAHDIIVAAEQRVLAAYPRADIIIHADPALHTLTGDADMAAPEPTADATSDLITDAEASPKGPWG